MKSVKNMVTEYMLWAGNSFLLSLIGHFNIVPLILLGRFIPTHHVDTSLLSLFVASGKTVSLFILNHIICRYGVPSKIITDNGGQFQNKDIKQLCMKFKIKQHWSSIYFPQGNGQVEASNKAILTILHRTIHKNGRD